MEKKELRLEISVKWFDQWKLYWSCSETTWKRVTEKLNGPIVKGVAIGAGIAIGVGATVYGSVQMDKALNPALRSTSIEAPAPKR
jgi:ABC-type nitrate/sulfonate/bicarbonate transport system permease component